MTIQQDLGTIKKGLSLVEKRLLIIEDTYKAELRLVRKDHKECKRMLKSIYSFHANKFLNDKSKR